MANVSIRDDKTTTSELGFTQVKGFVNPICRRASFRVSVFKSS